MSQDIIADALNQIMNAKKARKEIVTVKHFSKNLVSVLAIFKLRGYIKNYKTEGSSTTIELGNIHGCSAIKPRFNVSSDEIKKYIKRYLPASDIGLIIVSTDEGLMTHYTAMEKRKGGSLIAYIY